MALHSPDSHMPHRGWCAAYEWGLCLQHSKSCTTGVSAFCFSLCLAWTSSHSHFVDIEIVCILTFIYFSSLLWII